MSNRQELGDALPGMESLVDRTDLRPCEIDMSDAHRFTGEVLFRDHPDVFKAVAASFFVDGLSIRATAARYRVSVNTVRAIRDMALEGSATDAGRAAFFIKSKADRLQGIVRNRALEELHDRLSNPEESKDIDVDTLMRLAKLGENDMDHRSTSTTRPDADIIDVEAFDDVINGLNREKKSAGEDPGDVAGERVEEKVDAECGEAGSEGTDSGGSSLSLSDKVC